MAARFRRHRGWRFALVALLAVAMRPADVRAQGPGAQRDPAQRDTAPRELAQRDLAQYAGEYHWAHEPAIVAAMSVDSGRLFHQREGRPREALVPDPGAGDNADRFAIPTAGAHVVFVRDAEGSVTGCRFVADSDGHVKVEETRTSAALPHLLPYREYTRMEAMIPMRDGVRLHAVILRPSGDGGEAGALPMLMERTPYGVDDNDSEHINAVKPELASSGYIFVFEDIRGRYKSEGRFVMNRPVVPHTRPTDVDETTDTHDTIDWLLANESRNNGRVGVYGVSYPGFLAMMAGIDPHPAVKAISPQAPMTDVWLADDFFHNGAFRETYAFDYVQEMEGQKTDVRVSSKEDTYDFFLREGNFAKAAAAAKMADLPTAKAFLGQPAYTAFWHDMAVEYRLNDSRVPTLEVGGFWDQEDMWGTQAEYAALKPHDGAHQVFLVLGPWNHGGWQDNARRLGALDFGQATGIEYRRRFEAPFFERYLKDRVWPEGRAFDLADTASFRTGVNEWRRYAAWPPRVGFTAAQFFLEPGGALSLWRPGAGSAEVAARYVSDPADPIPYRHRPIQSTYAAGSRWSTWLVEDQRFVSGRKDLANFSTAVLDHDVTVTGEVVADLFASTSGTDGDLVVKLIDVYPDDAAAGGEAGGRLAGYELMVASEIFRGRYLHSFEQPQALEPGKVNEFRWSLHGADHTFLKGHRILVEVQSTWFPLYDRNPQTFVPNIMYAPAKAYRRASVTIYSGAKYPSHLDVQVAQ
ncbi:MAG: CocE/NonD family hydrolase [Acidobacteriota bacterium]|nr:CocE/NonD family hydrolase [Acidobacteriota bacterium]